MGIKLEWGFGGYLFGFFRSFIGFDGEFWGCEKYIVKIFILK